MNKFNVSTNYALLIALRDLNTKTKVANCLSVTRPTLDRHITHIEELFSIKLLKDLNKLELTDDGLYVLKELEKANIILESLSSRQKTMYTDLSLIYDSKLDQKFNDLRFGKIQELITKFNNGEIEQLIASEYIDFAINNKNKELYKSYEVYLVGNEHNKTIIRQIDYCLFKHLTENDISINFYDHSIEELVLDIKKGKFATYTIFPELYEQLGVNVSKVDVSSLKFYKYS